MISNSSHETNLLSQVQQAIGNKNINIQLDHSAKSETDKSSLKLSMTMKNGTVREVKITSSQADPEGRLAEISAKFAHITNHLSQKNQDMGKLLTSDKTRLSIKKQLDNLAPPKKQDLAIGKLITKSFEEVDNKPTEKSENTNSHNSTASHKSTDPTIYLPKNIREFVQNVSNAITSKVATTDKAESKLNKMYEENKELFDLLNDLCTLKPSNSNILPANSTDTPPVNNTKENKPTEMDPKKTLSLVKEFAAQAIKEKCVGTEPFKLAEHFLSRLTGPGGTVGEDQLRKIRGDSKPELERLSAQLACIQSRGTLNARYTVIEKYISASIKIESEIKANTPLSLINAEVGSKQKEIFNEANKKTNAMEMSKGINDLCGFISKAVLAWDPVLSDWSKKLEAAIALAGTDKEKEEPLKKLRDDLKEFKNNLKYSLEIENMNSLNDVDKMAETLGDSLISKLPAIVTDLTKAGINLAPG